MRVPAPVTLGLLSLVPLALPRAARGQADPSVLVAAERAFGRDVAERGIRDGFLAHLDDDAIVLQPGPENARETYEARPASPGLLTWEPAYAEIAAAGDLGWTTGPWEFRPGSPADDPVAAGHYVTLWRIGDDGTARAVLDAGVSHGPVAPVAEPALRTLGGSDSADPPAVAASLLDADAALAAAVRERGPEAAYAARAAADLRVYREGAEPAIGREAALAAAGRYGPVVPESAEARVSRSGDLGYVWGAAPEGGYLRIWRRGPDGAWSLALDLATTPAREAPSDPSR